MANKKVICYIQYALKLGIKSPLCVSGGTAEMTDCDVQKDFDGNPFIPGTSLAGALRGYLEECKGKKRADEINKVFGYSDDSESFMSRIKISDLYFTDKDAGAKVITRDGIKLERKLTVKGAKFDMEAIDTGAVCKCYLLLTVREGDDQSLSEAIVEQALAGLMWGEIRLGANKNRGFGELSVLTAKKKTFSQHNMKEWLDFDREVFLNENGNELQLKKPDESRYLTIRVPLKQKGGISIRRYSVIPGEPDYEHIRANGCPVIPGSSFNGAIRTRVAELLAKLKIDPEKINEWFGYVKNEKRTENGEAVDRQSSNIVISESVIEGGVDISMTRTKINRYDASVVSGALYSEKSHFDGSLVLEIEVRKNCYTGRNKLQTEDTSQYEPIVGMLLIVAKDIQNGYLAVGGQTAVGRGIFEAAGPIELLGTDKNEQHFIKAVGALCKGE